MSGMRMDKQQMLAMMKNPMMQNMLGDQAEEIEKLLEDDKTVQQMAGFWKHLDEMSSSDKKGYDDFIKKQMDEHREYEKQQNKEREAKRIVKGTPLCTIKILCQKVIEQKKEKQLSDSIKLFDFDQNAEFNQNFLESQDASSEPIKEPKIYLNILSHDKVIPPMNMDRKPADPKDDRQWKIIPISFQPSKESWSKKGIRRIHVDTYVATCVADMFKTSVQKIGAITNYILQKFQVMLKEHYIFHKKSMKALKTKKYKAHRGSNGEIPEIVLPEAYHVDHFEKTMKKVKDLAKKMNPSANQPQQPDLKDVKMPTLSNQQEFQKSQKGFEEEKESKIVIPGITDQKKAPAKSPIIMEIGSDKYKPNHDVQHLPADEDGIEKVQYVFQVSEESSAKDIEIDVSQQELKLSSANYEFDEKFKGFSVDETSVKAKFSKKKGTLTLTLQKKK